MVRYSFFPQSGHQCSGSVIGGVPQIAESEVSRPGDSVPPWKRGSLRRLTETEVVLYNQDGPVP